MLGLFLSRCKFLGQKRGLIFQIFVIVFWSLSESRCQERAVRTGEIIFMVLSLLLCLLLADIILIIFVLAVEQDRGVGIQIFEDLGIGPWVFNRSSLEETGQVVDGSHGSAAGRRLEIAVLWENHELWPIVWCFVFNRRALEWGIEESGSTVVPARQKGLLTGLKVILRETHVGNG